MLEAMKIAKQLNKTEDKYDYVAGQHIKQARLQKKYNSLTYKLEDKLKGLYPLMAARGLQELFDTCVNKSKEWTDWCRKQNKSVQGVPSRKVRRAKGYYTLKGVNA